MPNQNVQRGKAALALAYNYLLAAWDEHSNEEVILSRRNEELLDQLLTELDVANDIARGMD